MLSDLIFKRDSLGNIRTWQYEVDGDRWRTIAGLKVGAKVESGWTVCTPKSQDTAEAQAQFEADAEMKKKLERTYHASEDAVDTPNFFEPMLAQTYKGGMPAPIVICQPKLDGIRCIASAAGLFSRQGKRIFGVPHIEEQLGPVFDANPDLTIDGELYNHELRDDFNTITSVVRKQPPTGKKAARNPGDYEAQLQRAATLIQYHVYDAPSFQEGYLDRMGQLGMVMAPFGPTLTAIKEVPYEIALSVEAIESLYGRWVDLGYEGQMIRLNLPYEQKRSKTLLKHKSFVDDEFTLVDIQEGLGNWAGYGKKIVCRLPDGREFGAGVKGNQEFTKGLLDRRENLIGGQVTVRYFALTPDGVPRFPVAVDFHAEGRVD